MINTIAIFSALWLFIVWRVDKRRAAREELHRLRQEVRRYKLQGGRVA